MAMPQWSGAMCSPANACATLYVTQQLPALSNCNIERAQVLQAFEASACSQGCMNNFLFGDSSFGYYETIAGGSGAGPFFDGTSGVHTHMTNTRITDPEILERRWGSFVVVFRFVLLLCDLFIASLAAEGIPSFFESFRCVRAAAAAAAPVGELAATVLPDVFNSVATA